MTVRWPSSRFLHLLERELLWFTLLVPILAIAAFLCGGVCSVWQWWVAALVVVSSGFCRHDRLEAVWATVCFFGWMAVVWVLLGVLANPGGWDEVAYHFPAVRLLEQGWNPLRVRTPEAFKEVFGFVQGQMEIYHVLFQMKSVWIFNAVAMKFSGDFFSPMFPLTLFVFPAVSLRLCRLVNGWLCRSLVLVLVYFIIPRCFFSLDASLVLAAIGLMACFYGIVRGERPDVLALAGYTLAMLAIKLPGIGHALVFWSVFGVFVLWRRIRLGRIFMAIGIAIVGFLPLSITPFVTGVIDYGHPLYPHCSGDSRHPPVDICHDFNWKCNVDYRSMGHCGAWVNAYVSPSLARMYYRWQSGREDFDPRNRMFLQYPGLSEDDGMTALHWSVRVAFWSAVAFLCAFCGWPGRMIAIMVLMGMAAVPTRMIGYARYVPWMMSPLLFAAVGFSGFPGRTRSVLAGVLLWAIFMVRPLTLKRQICETSFDLWCSALMRDYLSPSMSTPPLRIYPSQSQRWETNLILTQRAFPLLAKAEVVHKWGEDLLSVPDWLTVFPGCFFGYDAKTSFPELEDRMRRHPFEKEGWGRYRTMWRVYVQDVPRLLLRRLHVMRP